MHIWWHKSLFHIELGQYDGALQIYEGPILATMRPASMSICNGVALLWRLDMLGCELGDRWQHLAAKWEGHADGKLYVFPRYTRRHFRAESWSHCCIRAPAQGDARDRG